MGGDTDTTAVTDGAPSASAFRFGGAVSSSRVDRHSRGSVG